MIVFKGCAKCEGDLYLERELGDTDLVCLQCGYRRTIRSWAGDMQTARRQRRSANQNEREGEREREALGV